MLSQGFMQIFDKVYRERGFDFRQYKEASLKRRIERRLRARRVDSYQQYTEILDKDPEEYKNLLDDLTIKVTQFFRDPEAWQILGEKVLPEIIREKRGEKKDNEDAKPISRIWSAGCATGQETYSIAILIEQFLEKKDARKVNIWGTDIDKESLLNARQAEYKPKMIKGISEDILNEYFGAKGKFGRGPFRGVKIDFRFHDLVLERPLKAIDLIICRNVVIYFDRPLQEKVFMDFYQGLNEHGYLFLGKTESLIGPVRERFKVIDKRWKIYQKEKRSSA